MIYLPLNDVHVALGGKMVPFGGFNMPVRYTSDIQEHICVREKAGLFDVSHMGEFVISGPKALELIQYVTSNDASVLEDWKIQYSSLINENGGIIDDLLVYKITNEKYILVVNASNIDKDFDWITKQNEKIGADVRNVSNNYCLFALQGPLALTIINKLSNEPLDKLTYYSFGLYTLANLPTILISRTGYTGAGGFEIYVPINDGSTIWNLLLETGEPFGLQPIGLGARDTLRLEMGYCLYGNDINDTTSPLEAGLSWITKLNKDFIGKNAVLDLKEKGISKKLVGIKMIERGIPRSHYEIVNASNEVIGEITSGTQSPSLSIGIGMAYLQTAYAKAGTEVFVKIRDKNIKAEVVSFPFVKSNV